MTGAAGPRKARVPVRGPGPSRCRPATLAAGTVGRRSARGPQPFARAWTRSRAPLNLSWSPTVGPVEVYCHIV
ncbi:hypothetical protein GCM10010335_41910 [Streptomyces galbus]|nr:hypothetical protein GCM10010335_41910 [Streptomyces galbus]